MIKREISDKIKELSSKYPVIQITGPRQSGKTTLVKELFSDYEYKNLENLDQRLIAEEDPKRFLALGSGKKMIIDEVQEVPSLMSYIQTEVDEQKINSQFVITGSQNFKIAETVSQSLAGRVAIFELLPFSYSEISSTKFGSLSTEELVYTGFFPGIYKQNISPIDFYRNFTNTYVTKDVRQIKNIGNLSTFQRFLGLLAGRVGQVLNMSSLANDTGISAKTIEQWLSLLEASYLIIRLQPYFENTSKRLIKSPKIYFTDTGLVCYLLGIDSKEELEKHFIYGSLFENFVILDKLKHIFNSGENSRLYFWRDNKGVEVDLIEDRGLDKNLIEIKSSKTFNIDFVKNIKSVRKVLEDRYTLNSYIVYDGDVEQEIHDSKIVNWRHFLN